MTNKYKGIIPLLIIPLILSLSCSHTNELAKFDLLKRTVLFKHYSKHDLTRVNVSIDNEYIHGDDPFVVILTDIGESYMESEVSEKMQKALNPDSISISISNGIKEGLITYYNMKPVISLADDPQYIVAVSYTHLTLPTN